MKRNFKCPKCKTDQTIGKKLRASWTCPHCHYALIPTKEMRSTGTAPFRSNFTFFKEKHSYKKPFKSFYKKEVTNE